jgi:hypothetical protein
VNVIVLNMREGKEECAENILSSTLVHTRHINIALWLPWKMNVGLLRVGRK